MTDVIFQVISHNIHSKIIECVAPETLTFKEILENLLKFIVKKRILVPLPIFIANFTARIFQLLPFAISFPSKKFIAPIKAATRCVEGLSYKSL